MDESDQLRRVLGDGRQAPGARRDDRRSRRPGQAGQHLPAVLGARRVHARPKIGADHGLAAEAGPEGRAKVDALAKAGQASWADTLRMAKELGEVDIQACSLSMDVLAIEEADLDPLVDGVEGVTAFYLNAGDGRIIFI